VLNSQFVYVFYFDHFNFNVILYFKHGRVDKLNDVISCRKVMINFTLFCLNGTMCMENKI
jgi:hypothetical protein